MKRIIIKDLSADQAKNKLVVNAYFGDIFIPI